MPVYKDMTETRLFGMWIYLVICGQHPTSYFVMDPISPADRISFVDSIVQLASQFINNNVVVLRSLWSRFVSCNLDVFS